MSQVKNLRPPWAARRSGATITIEARDRDGRRVRAMGITSISVEADGVIVALTDQGRGQIYTLGMLQMLLAV